MSAFEGNADLAIPDDARFMSTRSSVMGPMMSSLPSERHAAELMLLSVVNAWPPHHAVRGSGEPI